MKSSLLLTNLLPVRERVPIFIDQAFNAFENKDITIFGGHISKTRSEKWHGGDGKPWCSKARQRQCPAEKKPFPKPLITQRAPTPRAFTAKLRRRRSTSSSRNSDQYGGNIDTPNTRSVPEATIKGSHFTDAKTQRIRPLIRRALTLSSQSYLNTTAEGEKQERCARGPPTSCLKRFFPASPSVDCGTR